MYFSKLIYLYAILFCLLFSSGCDFKKKQWTVVTSDLPIKISTATAFDRPVAYILKQTHEPLFYTNGNGEYHSNLLRSWYRNELNTLYKLCPLTEFKFENNQPFDVGFLDTFFKFKLSSLYDENFKTKVNQNCLEIFFERPTERFLFDFSQIDNAPTLIEDGKPFEYGLGDFKIETINKNKIELVRKKYKLLGVSKVNFLNLDYYNNLKNKEEIIVQDANTLSDNSIIKSISSRSESSELRFTQMNNYVLMINISNKLTRKDIFECTDVKLLAQGLLVNNEINVFSKSIIPPGMIGESAYRRNVEISSYCKKSKIKDKKISFFTWKSANENVLLKAFENVSSNLKISKVTYEELSKRIDNGDYDLIALSVDTTNFGFKGIFTSLFDVENGLFKKPVKEFEDLILSLKKALSLEREKETALNIDRRALQNFWILPIGPSEKKIYLPKGYNNFRLSDDFLLFPKISEIRIKVF